MISIKQFNKKTILFTIIPILVLFLLIIYITFTLFYSNTNSTSNSTNNDTQDMITLTNTPGMSSTDPALIEEQKKLDGSFTQAMQDYEKSSPLLRYMPVHENLFTIDYMGKGIYRITLLGLNKTLAKNESRKWWISHQVNPDNLNIEYLPEI